MTRNCYYCLPRPYLMIPHILLGCCQDNCVLFATEGCQVPPCEVASECCYRFAMLVMPCLGAVYIAARTLDPDIR